MKFKILLPTILPLLLGDYVTSFVLGNVRLNPRTYVIRQFVYREDGTENTNNDKKNNNNNNNSSNSSNSDSNSVINNSSNEFQNSTREELRIKNLERLVASQSVEISRLKTSVSKMNEVLAKVQNFVNVLEKAGLDLDDEDLEAIQIEFETEYDDDDLEDIENIDMSQSQISRYSVKSDFEYVDDMEIFGSAPSSVTEAADSAGAAVLAALLAGKLRMLVDVRDAELSRDPELLVNFIELAILPVAAGLEGLDRDSYHRTRLKIVFPTMSQLLQYRKCMALSAPDVVALSTLGFDCIEDMDNLVVLIAPPPDDDEGLAFMNKLLNPDDPSMRISQPIVVLNYHMFPIESLPSTFEIAYHLRLLSVSFMASGDVAETEMTNPLSRTQNSTAAIEQQNVKMKKMDAKSKLDNDSPSSSANDAETTDHLEDDAELKAAMEHAADLAQNQDHGTHKGTTRAMVIRAYPRPWHIFVDLAPDEDVDFEVAATFDEEPSVEDVHTSIVECIEGSEIEEELVAQQMQAALEAGQLEKVNKWLDIDSNKDKEEDDEGEEDSADTESKDKKI